jgi:hypothetical protein
MISDFPPFPVAAEALHAPRVRPPVRPSKAATGARTRANARR